MADKLKIYKLSNEDYAFLKANPDTPLLLPRGKTEEEGAKWYSWNGKEAEGIISIKAALNVTTDASVTRVGGGAENSFGWSLTPDGFILSSNVTKSGKATYKEVFSVKKDGNVTVSGDLLVGGKVLDQTAITNTELKYALGNDTINHPADEQFKFDTPVWTEGQYIWQRMRPVYMNGAPGNPTYACIQGLAGKNGTDGKSVYKLDVFNQFDSVPCNSAGTPKSDYDWKGQTTHTVKATLGTTTINIEAVCNTVESIDPNKITLLYTATNVIYEPGIPGTIYSAYIKGLSADIGTVDYTLWYKGEVLGGSKFEAVKIKAGESAYKLEIDNEFVSVPADYEGKMYWTGSQWSENTKHSFSAYFGSTEQTIKDVYITRPTSGLTASSFIIVADEIKNIELTKNADNSISVVKDSLSTANDGGYVNYSLYKVISATDIGSAIATAKFEVTKQKSGDPSTSYKIITSDSVIRKTKAGALIPAADTGITFEFKKQTGTAEMTAFTNCYYKVWADDKTEPSTPSVSTTGSIVFKDYTLNTTKVFCNLYLQGATAGTYVLVDKESLKVVDDGSDAVDYWLTASKREIVQTKGGTKRPSEIEIQFYKQVGDKDGEKCPGYFSYAIDGTDTPAELLSTGDKKLDSTIINAVTEQLDIYFWSDADKKIKYDYESLPLIVDGTDGTSFNVKGTVANWSSLPTTATNGDGYIVTDASDDPKIGTKETKGVLYVYNKSADPKWIHCGKIKGEDGENGTDATNYYLQLSSNIHTGSSQESSISIAALYCENKVIKGDSDAWIRYKWGNDGSWTTNYDETGKKLWSQTKIDPTSIFNENLIIQAAHSASPTWKTEDIYEDETITYSPKNTPVLDLDNDRDAIDYKADKVTKENADDYVQSTGGLFLNGEEITSGVTFSWTLVNCAVKPDTPTNTATIKISTLSANNATATCNATYKENTYTKVFTINKSFTGNTGAKGDPGKGLASTEVRYAQTETQVDPTTIPEADWKTKLDSINDGWYVWTRTKLTYTSGDPSITYNYSRDPKDGIPGKGISDTEIMYQEGDSGTTPPTGTWTTDRPAVAQGNYLWTRIISIYTDGTRSNPAYSVSYSSKDGVNGKDGSDGVDGKDGTSIVWQDTTTRPTNPQEGWAYYDAAAKKSYVYKSGTWYQMTVDGVNGANGKDGNDGLSIVWKGDLKEPPENPEKNWAYRDTDNGVCYIYNGASWVMMTHDGSDGADGTDGDDGLSVFITYNDSTTKPSAPTGEGTTGGWHTNATDAAIWMSQKVAESASTGTWGNPIKVKGTDGNGYKFSVQRDSFTDAEWQTYGAIGHEEYWTGTGQQATDTKATIGDMITIVGTSTDGGNGYTLTGKIISFRAGTNEVQTVTQGLQKSNRGNDGPKGDKGDPGADGRSINVKANAEACTQIGDGYIDQNETSTTYGHLMILTSLSPKQFTDGGEIKGPKGNDAVQYYIHYVYNNSTTEAADYSTTETRKYIGTYVDTEKADATTFEIASAKQGLIWSQITGDKGTPGQDGKDAPEIDKIITQYQVAATESELNPNRWVEDPTTLPTVSEGYFIWTRTKTTFKAQGGVIPDPTYSSPIKDSAYALAQGKSTNYYSEVDPWDNGTGVQIRVIKVNDCWFDIGYSEVPDSTQWTEQKQYIGYHISNGSGGYTKITSGNYTTVTVGTMAYTTGLLRQCDKVNSSTGKPNWVDISDEIVKNKVTANYINAMDITAQKIKITNGANTVLYANASDAANTSIGGFTVAATKLYSETVSLDTNSINIGNDNLVLSGDKDESTITSAKNLIISNSGKTAGLRFKQEATEDIQDTGAKGQAYCSIRAMSGNDIWYHIHFGVKGSEIKQVGMTTSNPWIVRRNGTKVWEHTLTIPAKETRIDYSIGEYEGTINDKIEISIDNGASWIDIPYTSYYDDPVTFNVITKGVLTKGTAVYSIADIVPDINNSATLGSTTNKWNTIYTNNIGSSSTRVSNAYIDYLGGTSSKVSTIYATDIGNESSKVSNIYTVNLGSSDALTNHIYTTNLNGLYAGRYPYVYNNIPTGKKVRIYVWKYVGTIKEDQFTSLQATTHGCTTAVIGVSVCGMATSHAEGTLSNHTHTGDLCAHIDGTTVYIGADSGSVSEGFYCVIIGY